MTETDLTLPCALLHNGQVLPDRTDMSLCSPANIVFAESVVTLDALTVQHRLYNSGLPSIINDQFRAVSFDPQRAAGEFMLTQGREAASLAPHRCVQRVEPCFAPSLVCSPTHPDMGWNRDPADIFLGQIEPPH